MTFLRILFLLTAFVCLAHSKHSGESSSNDSHPPKDIILKYIRDNGKEVCIAKDVLAKMLGKLAGAMEHVARDTRRYIKMLQPNNKKPKRSAENPSESNSNSNSNSQENPLDVAVDALNKFWEI